VIFALQEEAFHLLWLGIGLFVVVTIVFIVWRISRSSVHELGSVSEEWVAEQRRK
jgi:hypothetical protein